MITPRILSELLIALNECTERGRVAISSFLNRYEVRRRASTFVNEWFPNSNMRALAAVKVILLHYFLESSLFCCLTELGCHDPSIFRDETRPCQGVSPQDGASTGDYAGFTSRVTVGSAPKYQSFIAKTE
jgi:hypothetical protein